MTETPFDVLGYDTPAFRRYMASLDTWCVKHRKPHERLMGTGCWYVTWCPDCDEERYLTNREECATLPPSKQEDE